MASDVVKKRTDYLEWHEYFMSVAFLSAQRSKDPKYVDDECWLESAVFLTFHQDSQNIVSSPVARKWARAS